MLFWLHPSLVESIKDPSKTETTCIAIERIVYSQIHGNHLYFADYNTLDYLSQENHISKRIREHIRRTYNHYSQGGIFRRFSPLIVVCWGENLLTSIKQDNSQEFRISPDVIINSRVTEQAIFLSENTRDIEFYDKITRVFMWRERLSNSLAISFESIGGGGNTISDQYSLFQRENQKLCFCVVDPDYSYPASHVAETAARLIQIHELNTTRNSLLIFCDYVILKSREIENLIPQQLLFELADGNPQLQEFANLYYQFVRSNDDARFFLDVKSGINFKNIITHTNKAYIEYWSTHLQSWSSNCSYYHEKTCLADCNCHVIPGMGDNTLENILKILMRFTPQKLDEMVKTNPQLMDQWLEIGKSIFFWFVCSRSLYIN